LAFDNKREAAVDKKKENGFIRYHVWKFQVLIYSDVRFVLCLPKENLSI